MYKCIDCNKECKDYEFLRKHRSRSHKIHSSKTYVDYFLKGIHPKCKCGCGGEVNWHRRHKGKNKFNPFIYGHHNRVHNNWGHNKKAQEKSAETRRKQYANGERFAWCKGLTKDTDVRLKLLGEKSSKTIKSNPDELTRRSKRMSNLRKSGVIPTLYGNEHSQWKGGISTIQQISRGDKRIYHKWKFPILKRDGFKCVNCNSEDELHVHHNKETFSDIIKKVMTLDDYENINDHEVKKNIADKILEYHINENVSGITLCKKCHGDIHPSLNFHK